MSQKREWHKMENVKYNNQINQFGKEKKKKIRINYFTTEYSMQ